MRPCRIHHRQYLAVARAWIGFEGEAFEADALLDNAYEARIDRGGLAEQIAEFADGVVERGALLGPQPLVALPRQVITDDACERGRAHGEDREEHDQLRRRQHPLARVRRLGKVTRASRAGALHPRQQRAARLYAGRLWFDLAVHRIPRATLRHSGGDATDLALIGSH